MNTLKLDNEGGLLFYQDVLAFMQSGMKAALTGICKAIGDNVIISGCEITGGNISAGLMVIGDEIVAFSGGVNGGFVAVETNTVDAMYEDEVPRPLYQSVTAVPAGAGIPIANFVRISTLRHLSSDQGFILPIAKYEFDSGALAYPHSSSPLNFVINHNKDIEGRYYVVPVFYVSVVGETLVESIRPPVWYTMAIDENNIYLQMSSDGFTNLQRLRVFCLFYKA
ncbi:hypothetical protein ABDK00_016845 [Niabella insulamsoli]|uniref:hypothetical protein n=1 Tax=Niabella insulamsoli TaxID=3144874 RepID=UPI0031FCE478